MKHFGNCKGNYNIEHRRKFTLAFRESTIANTNTRYGLVNTLWVKWFSKRGSWYVMWFLEYWDDRIQKKLIEITGFLILIPLGISRNSQ